MNKEMSEVLKALQAPFEPNEIEWRVQSATSKDGQYKVLILPYIDSRAVQKRLDDVVGPFWKVDYEKIIVNNIEGFQATITIKLGEEWISRSDGAGATVDELRNLVKGVFYANKYINHCRSLGLGEQESLHLAQLPMCIELSEVSALFFKMDKVLLEKAIDYVNAEKEQTA